jgi:preprotein translocase subunit Sec63
MDRIAPLAARARDEAIDRALVVSRHALVVEGDYFQILGVSRDAGAQEIRRAHEVLAAELSPEALHPTVGAELATELTEIRLVLAEAARLMTNDRLRQQYREAMPVAAAAMPERPPG